MKITSKQRKTINGKLSDLSRVRHSSIPLSDINEMLKQEGFAGMESMLLCGRDGHTTIEYGADNSLLVLSWYKGEYDGKYELTSYLS